MAKLTTLPFDHQHAGLDFDGVLVSGEHPNAPSVLVFHGMEGRSDAQVDFCHLLAEVGYKAVAVDLFGRAVTAAGADACAAAMDEFLKDRSALRDRIIGVTATIRELPAIDPVALAAELTERGADWQLHAYGHAMHAFMATFANAPERGITYDDATRRRAWVSLLDFLAETFAGER
jgi:dienelactone hydrolase